MIIDVVLVELPQFAQPTNHKINTQKTFLAEIPKRIHSVNNFFVVYQLALASRQCFSYFPTRRRERYHSVDFHLLHYLSQHCLLSCGQIFCTLALVIQTCILIGLGLYHSNLLDRQYHLQHIPLLLPATKRMCFHFRESFLQNIL